MNTKTLIAGLLGGIAYFFLGWLLYGMLLASTFESLMGSAQGVNRSDDEMVLWALAIGNLAMGLAMAYILNNWAKVSTVQTGAINAATVALMLSLGYDLMWFSTTHLMTLSGVLLDVVVYTAMSAIAGAIIGWWLGRSAN
ncbi:MAG: hypothetical protein IPM92_02155 [Saprospiraceae bacterium]|nr:hypothetical protein [Saprospiraceae bacterium]